MVLICVLSEKPRNYALRPVSQEFLFLKHMCTASIRLIGPVFVVCLFFKEDYGTHSFVICGVRVTVIVKIKGSSSVVLYVHRDRTDC